MRLYVFIAFLIVCILAVNAAQQNNGNKRTQLAKRKSSNGAVATSNHLAKAKPRARSASKSKKVRKVKPALTRRPKKVVRRVVKKSSRRSNAPKKIARKGSNRNSIRRGSRGGSRKRLAKQELSDTTENKSIGAGQANGGVEKPSADKPQDTLNQAAPKPDAAPVQPAIATPVASPPASAPASVPAKPAVTGDSNTIPLSSPAQGNPLASSPFNIPKATGQNQAIGAAFSQSSNGGSAFAGTFLKQENAIYLRLH